MIDTKFKQAIWFLLPSFAGLMVFFIVPFVGSIQYAFFSTGYNPQWVGFEHFRVLLESDFFRMAMKNTGIFTLFNVPVVVMLSFLLANLAWSTSKLGSFFRGSMVVTYMLPIAALVSVWSLLFDAAGPVNQMLETFGVQRIRWLDSGNLRWPVIFMYIWKNTGFNMIIMLAGLNAIDKNILEAATVDGAGWLKRQIRIVAPQMFPTLFFVTVLSTVNSLKIFKEAYLLGGPYPEDSIYTVQHFINNQFFQSNYSFVVSASLMFVFAIYVVVLVLYRFEKRYRES